MSLDGVGELTAVAILAELGDTRRFNSSRQAVRYAGLDITVHQSDQRRAPGHLSRQGPPALRWALYEAAQAARRPGSPTRLLRPSRRTTRRQPRLPRARPQTAQAQLPRPARTRRPSPPTGLTDHGGRCARSPSTHRCPAARSPHAAAATFAWTASKDRAAATRHPAGTPHINHHVTDPKPRVADRDKPGRPHAPHPPRPPRTRPTLPTTITPEVDATDRHR